MARSFLIALVAALLLGRLGPFGTFEDLSTGQRYAYWVGLTLLLWVQVEVALALLRGSARFVRLPWVGRSLIAALAAAVPGAFEVAWAESLLRVERDLGLLDVAKIYGDVALIAAALALLLSWRGERPAAALRQRSADEGGLDRLMATLPPERRGRLAAFAAEDHYLRVYTDRGEALVLRRFGDALVDVESLDGLRVHRSWWVARAAVQGAEREGERITLLISDGVRVPVSRTYLLAVREAGLLSS